MHEATEYAFHVHGEVVYHQTLDDLRLPVDIVEEAQQAAPTP